MWKRLSLLIDLAILGAVFGLGTFVGWEGRAKLQPAVYAAQCLEDAKTTTANVIDTITFWD